VSQTYEIIPGTSIGPFRLGMTRVQIEGLRIDPMESSEDQSWHRFPLSRVDAHQPAGEVRVGVTIHYDATGHACRLTAIFGYNPSEAPVFSLFGEVVNGMTDGTVGRLLLSITNDVEYGYGTVSSASAGLTANKWEAIDDEIMCINVVPRRVDPVD